MKKLLLILLLSACSINIIDSTNIDSTNNGNTNGDTTNDGSTNGDSTNGDNTNGDSTENSYLDTLDQKYPYFNIKLKPFVVDDKDDSTGADNVQSRQITAEEKLYVLQALDLARFVVNTPEFEAEIRKNCYTFRAYESISGSKRSVIRGDAYDKNILLKVIKHAKITTYLYKTDIPDNGAGTLGYHYYTEIDLNNPVIKDDKFINAIGMAFDLLIMLPNRYKWTGETYDWYKNPKKGDLAALLFHEIVHNLGFNHINHVDPILNAEDTVNTLEDIFLEVIGQNSWYNKYKDELAKFDYYQKKYADWLETTTIAK